MKIVIDQELCSKIEALHYEVESRKAIITSFLSNTEMRMNNTFNQYQKEYQEYFVAYNLAREEMTAKYNVPASATWHLDFSSCELTY